LSAAEFNNRVIGYGRVAGRLQLQRVQDDWLRPRKEGLLVCWVFEEEGALAPVLVLREGFLDSQIKKDV
jgi:hypothetical protein